MASFKSRKQPHDCCWHSVQHCKTHTLRHTLSTGIDGRLEDAVSSEKPTLVDVLYAGFGELFYDQMVELIDKYLELGTADRVCYVGDCGDAAVIIPLMSERYCLTHSVTIVNTCACGVHENPSLDTVDSVFSLKFLPETNASSARCFDKIVIFDSIHKFEDLSATLFCMCKSLSDSGRVLMVHRPASLNTLPIPKATLAKLGQNDVQLSEILSVIRQLGLYVQWRMENTRIVTSRMNWLKLLMHRFPSRCRDVESGQQPIAESSEECLSALATGPLKCISTKNIEFFDRQIFIVFSKPSKQPETKKAKPAVSISRKLEMAVTPEIKALYDGPVWQHYQT